MKRSLNFARPDSDDEDYYGMSGSRGSRGGFDQEAASRRVNFVQGSEQSAKQFYGKQEVIHKTDARQEEDDRPKRRPLTADEKNTLAAKILKAELAGKTERVKSLRKKLDSGFADDSDETAAKTGDQSVILMKMDQRTGVVAPATSSRREKHESKPGSSSSTVLNSYERSADLKELLDEEKQTSAQQQLSMFDQAVKMTVGNKVDDDYAYDDNILTHKKRRRHTEKAERTEHSKNISEHQQLERTLASCQLCIDSPRFDKLTVVAIGFKTYLAVVPWKGLDAFHCRIIPSEHYSSTVTLDEDVHAELRLWRKGLVAMFGAENEDCVFLETCKIAKSQPHMAVECIPISRESGDLAPIYFKESLENAGAQWSTHKKIYNLADTKDKTVRSLIPKGFSYFSVDFGLQAGYAHVIEKESLFPSHFGQEIVGGIIDAEHKLWRNPETESKSDLKEKRDRFRERWKQFDWTEEARRRLNEEPE